MAKTLALVACGVNYVIAAKVVPMIGAGLSLCEWSIRATRGPASNLPMQNAVVSHKVTLVEEEICDVTLATFFDRENGGTFRRPVYALPRAAAAAAACAAVARLSRITQRQQLEAILIRRAI